MTEPIFFEIAIYRCPPEKHVMEQRTGRSALTKRVDQQTDPMRFRELEDFYDRKIGYTWKYNDSIGFLGLFIAGTQFRADYWKADKQRFRSGVSKKKFVYQGKALQKQIPPDMNSTEIFRLMKKSLSECQKEFFRPYYFDLSAFNVAGAFMDWKALTEKLNEYVYPDLKQSWFDKTNT